MIPTLFGRWQTRLFLTIFVGIPVTFFFGYWLYEDELRTAAPPFIILGYVLVLGFFWDIVYIIIQKFRWDRDWPFAFQFLTGVVEGALLYRLVSTDSLPWLPPFSSTIFFWLHYCTVFLCSFVVVFGPLKIFYPCWRYEGGQFNRS